MSVDKDEFQLIELYFTNYNSLFPQEIVLIKYNYHVQLSIMISHGKLQYIDLYAIKLIFFEHLTIL